MNLTNEMLSYKPKLFKDFIMYKRDEGKGLWVTRFRNNSLREQMVNDTFIKIAESFNGKNTIEKIIDTMANMYKNVDKNLLAKDIVITLYKIIGMDGLEFNGHNPFVESVYIETDQGYKVSLGDINNIHKIRDYIRMYESSMQNNLRCYVNPISDKSGIIFKVNQNKILSCLIEKDENVCGVILCSNVKGYVNTIDQIIINENHTENIDEIIKSALSVFYKVIEYDTKCFRAHIGENTSLFFEKYFKDSGLYDIKLLEDEVGIDRNIYECNFYI